MAGSGPMAEGSSRIVRWAFILIALAPFQLSLWHHLVAGGAAATGFLGYDAPYYVANGREIFERGNGFAHPNPYDPDPAAPIIYFQWLTWLFGFGVKVLHLDPGFIYVFVGLGAVVLGSALTLRLVESMLPGRRGLYPLFLLTMWGGGALCLGAMAFNSWSGRPPWDDLFVIDDPAGWWFPNWGRNFLISTESVYHALAALIWLGVLRGRLGIALLGAGLLASTHPFSGAQHLIILGAWLGYLAWRDRTPAAIGRVAVAAAMCALFAAYYFWFLNRYPSHRQLQADWAIGWKASAAFIVLASGPVAALAAWRLARKQWQLDDRDRFLLMAGGITLLLLKHDWLIDSHQPLHFSRGYNWLPFWLVALPALQELGAGLSAHPRRWLKMGGLVAGSGLLVFDNAAFIGREWQDNARSSHHLDGEQREMFGWMDRANLNGVMLCVDPRMSYLSATYTSVRPYIGHLANTPDIKRYRWGNVTAWHRRGEIGPWFGKIDYLLIERRHPPANFDSSGWAELHSNPGYLLLGRIP